MRFNGRRSKFRGIRQNRYVRLRGLAESAQRHFISVFQKGPLGSVGQQDGLDSAARNLQQAAARRGSGPETVPLPRRSPGRRSQPLEVWCANICANVQYRSRRFPRLTQMRGAIPLTHRGRSQIDLRSHIEAAPLLIVGISKVWQWLRVSQQDAQRPERETEQALRW